MNTTKLESATTNHNTCDNNDEINGIRFVNYVDESQLDHVMSLVGRDLSEPYSIFTYRYFLHRFPHLCIFAVPTDSDIPIGCVVGKIDYENNNHNSSSNNNHNNGTNDQDIDDELYDEEDIDDIGEPSSSLTIPNHPNLHQASTTELNSSVARNIPNDQQDKDQENTNQNNDDNNNNNNNNNTGRRSSSRNIVGYIGMLAVSKEYRRKGIGKILVSKILYRMKYQYNCSSVTLETEVTNISAQSLYQDIFGFIREELLVRYYLNWNDAYRLRLWL